jgi:hypothetical protein
MNKWSHDKLLETLKRRAGDIETLQKNKAQLQALSTPSKTGLMIWTALLMRGA